MNNQHPELCFSLAYFFNEFKGGYWLEPDLDLADQLDELGSDLVKFRAAVVFFELHHALEIPAKLINPAHSIREMVCAAVEGGKVDPASYESFAEIKHTILDQLALEIWGPRVPVSRSAMIEAPVKQ